LPSATAIKNGTALNVTEDTIEDHVNDILAKLGVTGRDEAIAEVIKLSLLHLR
jgi:DNA-binding CsgD family transcriptional regulator